MKHAWIYALISCVLACGGSVSQVRPSAADPVPPAGTSTVSSPTPDDSEQQVSKDHPAAWWFRSIVSPNDRFLVTRHALAIKTYRVADATMAGHDIAPGSKLRLARVRCEVDGNTARARCENASSGQDAGDFVSSPQVKNFEARLEACSVELEAVSLNAKQLREFAEEARWNVPKAPPSLDDDIFAVVEVHTKTKSRVSRNDCSAHFDSCRPGENCHPCDPAGPPWVINRFEIHRDHRVKGVKGSSAPATTNALTAQPVIRIPLIVFGAREGGWLTPASAFRQLSLINMSEAQADAALRAFDAHAARDRETAFVASLNAFALAARAGRADAKQRATATLQALEELDWNAAHFEFRRDVLPRVPELRWALKQFASGDAVAQDPCQGMN